MGAVKLFIPPPNPKQQLFFEARSRYINYGGARAGGKSWAMRIKFALLCLGIPGLQCLLLRRTLPELTENHVQPLLKLLKGIACYNKQEKVFTFPNGSRIKLGYCKNEDDVLQYQGQAYDVIGMDEATLFTEFQFNCLRESNRSSGMVRGQFSPRMYLTCNPGGVGHHWVKRLFVDRIYRDKERPEDYTFIPAQVYDNAAFMEMDPDYVAQLESLPEKRRRSMLLGDWNAIEGAFFEEFVDDPAHYEDRRFTHVIEPFDIPKGWSICRSFDFGYNKPFSCGWWAVDYDGVIYRILELYGCTEIHNEGLKWPPNKIFEEIARVEREHPWLKGKRITGVADPSIWDASRGESVEEMAAKQGVYFASGDNARIPGWMQMHYRMAFDENGYPMMYIFKNCKGFRRTIPALQYDDHKVEDLNTDGEDHIADETRYFCMSRPIAPTAVKEKKPVLDDPLDLMKEKRNPHNLFRRY
ncbi:MAG: terminase family protein [Clostridia bacterium]|nr:terminase family protein [Clostridia bacterium]